MGVCIVLFDKTQITGLLITWSNELIDSHVPISLFSSLSLPFQHVSLHQLVDNIGKTRDARRGRIADAKFLMQCLTLLASSEASEAAAQGSDSCCSRLKLLDSGTGGLGNPHPAPSVVVFDTFLLDPSDSVKQPIFSGGLKQTTPTRHPPLQCCRLSHLFSYASSSTLQPRQSVTR